MELEAIYESDDDDCTDISGPRVGEGNAQKLRGRSRCLLGTTVSLGLICALLLLFITLYIKITAERDLYKNTVEKLNHTISSLQHNNTNLKTEKQQLKNNWSQEKLKLETRVTSLREELAEASRNGSQCGLDRLFISSEAKNWSESRQYCRDHGADLVIIKSEEKQRLVSLLVKARMWIGLSDIETEGNLTWVDNSPLNQGFWREGEPNDEHGIEDCVEMMFSSTSALNNWNDLPCSLKRIGICEK